MNLFIITTVLSFLTVLAPLLFKPILTWLVKQTKKERNLLIQKEELKNNQLEISMIDNFAKYSKIQRKIIVIEQELIALQNERIQKSFKLKIVVMYSVRVMIGLVLVILSIYYRNMPIIDLRKYDLYPFSSLIAYPNDKGVSVHFWLLCSTAAAKLIKT